jgi:hypothetical protein
MIWGVYTYVNLVRTGWFLKGKIRQAEKVSIARSIFESFSVKPKLSVWYVLLTLSFVKGTRGYVKKAEPKPCLLIYHLPIDITSPF